MRIDTPRSLYNENPYQRNRLSGVPIQTETNVEKPAENLKKVEEASEKAKVAYEVKILERQQARIEAHEEAHQAMGGGGIVYVPMRGPDGKTYHVHGHVSIDTSDASTPEETVRKMSKVVAAAMAPANPSPADIGVATSAIAKRSVTQHQMAEEQATLKKMDEKRSDGQKTQVINIKVLGYKLSLYA